MPEPLVDLRRVPDMPAKDPNLDVPETPGTALDDLREELAADLSRGTVCYEVPARPGYTVTFLADIAAAKLMARRKQCVKGNDFDQMKFACIILALQCQSIEKHGEPITAEGKPLVFGSTTFQELVGVTTIPDAVDGVRRFYGSDGAILSTFEQLLVEAGYGQEVSAVDPTTRSSTG